MAKQQAQRLSKTGKAGLGAGRVVVSVSL